MSDDNVPLRGFTIGVTAARRADEFATLLTRRGAEVVHAPAIRIIRCPTTTNSSVSPVASSRSPRTSRSPPQRSGSAGGWAQRKAGDSPTTSAQALGASRILARGPKVTGAIRAAELREEWSPSSESSAEVLELLLNEGVAGRRIAVQLHGERTEWEPGTDVCEALRAAAPTSCPSRSTGGRPPRISPRSTG